MYIFIFTILSLIYSLNATSNQVNIGYVEHGPPFHQLTNGKLTGGLVYDVASAIAANTGKQAYFMNLPTNRVDDFLVTGKTAMICFHNPMWVRSPKRFHWGPVMFYRKEYFIIRNASPDIFDHQQLRGKSIATHLGYTYSKKTMALFKEGLTTRINKQKTALLYRLLKLNRVNALVDNEISFNYLKKQGVASGLRLSSLVDKKYPLHCAFSKNSPAIAKQLINAAHKMLEDKSMLSILRKYKSTTDKLHSKSTITR
ncbi:transporter substrate-binding domain-containing protein [Endozoicomonas sp. SM1973]|uniref:Transporter substrate-binding domain-containing protein n=1 Tax=Spartinivicinus marinus TaxID=2994442 RepID=A0A853I3Q7_9GAMM|nr:transporter substrate-binding domain-containing protein [Spartinivicinus marinus]MCX4026396.1 transporter substrate-binding domain-containing protein [Spartinivicinus marinus]NYZ67259.1 transporter substrate-binding domain-containing protein [Spartinivicinus marinus]